MGLVSGAAMAELGHTVICADIDAAKIEKLNNGIMPIYELGLEELVAKNVQAGRLSFTTDVGAAVEASDAVFNGVGTPEDKATGQADLQYVFAVAETFGKHLNGYKVLVNKSTVPVGTADRTREIVTEASGGKGDFDIVSNPEFLREGTAVKDFLQPDRVVVGTSSEKAKKVMQEIYAPLEQAGYTVMFTDVKSAEVIKYASNSFLATKISFINEMANFCSLVGGNVREVARGMGLDKRIGAAFLQAGIGYGGACFPKDVKALMHTGDENGYVFRILEAVNAVNVAQKMKPVHILKEVWPSFEGKRVAVWGLAFKPGTDDVREAPALEIIRSLSEGGAEIAAFDHIAEENARAALDVQNITYCSSAHEALKDADALVIATDWDEFRHPDYAEIKKCMRGNVIVDGRNIWNRDEAEQHGFTYFGIGV